MRGEIRPVAISYSIFNIYYILLKDGFQTFLLLDLYLFCQGHLIIPIFFINFENHFDYCFCWFLVHFSFYWL